MRKLTLAMTAVAASVLGTAAQAGPVVVTIPVTAPRDNDAIGSAANSTITSGTATCADPGAAGYACSFTSTFNFATPTGYNLASAVLSSTFTDANAQQNIDFTSISLNGVMGGVQNNVGGYNDSAFVNNVALRTGSLNTLTVTGNAGTTALGAAGAFSGVLTFAQSSPVPEPATWAMMLVGFGAAGYSLRRKKSSTIRMQAA